MELKLTWDPTPEYAGHFAEDIARRLSERTGWPLDFTPDSITILDSLLEQLRTDGVAADEIGETLFAFGCYVGEVLVRHADGAWQSVTGDHAIMAGSPIVVGFGDGSRWCSPIGKVFKRLYNGGEDSLRDFYAVVTLPRVAE
jgi:hypothetical protein